MKNRFPSFLKTNPFELFDKISMPVYVLVIVGAIFLRAWNFAKSGDAELIAVYTLESIFVLELILISIFLILGGRRVSQFSRFTVLYLAFVPKLKYTYIARILDINIIFSIREDLTNGKTKNAIAMWYPSITKYLLLLVPFIVILIMAVKSGDESLKEVKLVRKRYIIWFAVAAMIGLLELPFGNLENIGSYFISLILICAIWKLWEAIRKRKSYEPMPVVAWAEILLFIALLLKGIVEIVE
ncbi:MAG: hypothetical protein IJ796_11275 [Lachnospiraceae bacterium]|nr:hypothetical protein [Lachnospiraceae bacterium]